MMLETWIPWNLAVAASAIVGTSCFLWRKPLRMHSAAVVVSAAIWFLVWLTFLRPGESGGFAMAVGYDCFGVMYLFYHAFVCLALAMRVGRMWRREE